MQEQYQYTVVERFLRYVQIDTQSDPESPNTPSTEKQKSLSRLLVEELQEIGIGDAAMDEYGYVYATIPANVLKPVPIICFCAHVDTAPDCSGTGIVPILHKSYTGNDIALPLDATQVLSCNEYPYLQSKIGCDIITASGNTLLGSDDKAGVAEIMDLAHYLTTHPEIKHGEIKLLFTPDEEVGRGADKVDFKKLGAQFAYTLDGGEAGSLEDETFSANAVKVIIHGVSAHPGNAKNKLINALKIAGKILDALPTERLSPESTEGRKGFIHPVKLDGIAEKCSIDFIIRDFETPGLKKKEDFLKTLVEEAVKSYPGTSYEFIVKEQYRNMKEILDLHPEIIGYAKEAIEKAGLTVKMESIRGGTDGSRLSFMGLPCPNIFTGMQAIHSKLEHICVQDMYKAVDTLINLVQVWEQRA